MQSRQKFLYQPELNKFFKILNGSLVAKNIISKAALCNARKKLNSLGYNNVKIKFGDGYQGWKEYAPFDKIIITAAPTEIPPELIKQLKDGGLMVLPVGESYNQQLIVIEKNGDELKKENIIPVRFVPMIHKDE